MKYYAIVSHNEEFIENNLKLDDSFINMKLDKWIN